MDLLRDLYLEINECNMSPIRALNLQLQESTASIQKREGEN